MNIKKTIQASFFGILKEELVASNRQNRYLLLALFANIPTPFIFIPYVTQVITMILLGLYLYHYPKIEGKNDPGKSILEQKFLGIPSILFVVAGFTIFIQFFWVPFITQFLSIASILAVYILSTRLK